MKFIVIIIFALTALGGECSLEAMKEKLELQQKFCVGNWCLVPWKKGWCCSEILDMDSEQVLVRVLDTSLPVSRWPTKLFDESQIRSFRCAMLTQLEDLISYLRGRQILCSGFIEEGFKAVDRGWFIQENPYFDAAIDIPCGMCISTPHIHILSLELAKNILPQAKKILDVGTGTGYMAAICAYLAPEAHVYGIDCFTELVDSAENACRDVLPESMSQRMTFLKGKGEKGYAKEAPYDFIYVGYMCNKIPSSLVRQLKPGGILLIPVGSYISTYDKDLGGGNLLLIEKDEKEIAWVHKVCSCSFIPTQKKNPKACLEDPGE